MKFDKYITEGSDVRKQFDKIKQKVGQDGGNWQNMSKLNPVAEMLDRYEGGERYSPETKKAFIEFVKKMAEDEKE